MQVCVLGFRNSPAATRAHDFRIRPKTRNNSLSYSNKSLRKRNDSRDPTSLEAPVATAGNHEAMLVAHTCRDIERKCARPVVAGCYAQTECCLEFHVHTVSKLQQSTSFASARICATVDLFVTEPEVAETSAEACPKTEGIFSKNLASHRWSHEVGRVPAWHGRIARPQVLIRVAHEGHLQIKSSEIVSLEMTRIVDLEG